MYLVSIKRLPLRKEKALSEGLWVGKGGSGKAAEYLAVPFLFEGKVFVVFLTHSDLKVSQFRGGSFREETVKIVEAIKEYEELED